jgi:hypothetical protein
MYAGLKFGQSYFEFQTTEQALHSKPNAQQRDDGRIRFLTCALR